MIIYDVHFQQTISNSLFSSFLTWKCRHDVSETSFSFIVDFYKFITNPLVVGYMYV